MSESKTFRKTLSSTISLYPLQNFVHYNIMHPEADRYFFKLNSNETEKEIKKEPKIIIFYQIKKDRKAELLFEFFFLKKERDRK